MTYDEFKSNVKENIGDYLPEEYQAGNVDVVPVNKNNGIVLFGLRILMDERRIVPTLYLEDFYEMHQEGEPIEEVLSYMADVYVRTWRTTPDFDLGDFTYENVKCRLTVAVCNADMNRKLLQDVPHERKEDLALFYRVRVSAPGYENSMITIHNSYLEGWGIETKQLKKDAWESMKRENPAMLQNSEQAARDAKTGIFLETNGPESETSLVENEDIFVLRNSNKLQGAAYMFDTGTMDKIAEMLKSDLVVLPSSIHEIIILRDTGDVDMDYMRELVKEVNEVQVKPEERLSNEVYRYDRETHTLSLVRPIQPEESILPDRVSVEEMHDYGYTWDGMLPLTKAKALELMDCGIGIYRLTTDNAESLLSKKEEIYAYDGLFGVEKGAWKSYLGSQNCEQAEGIDQGMMGA